ncbi:hypothetical protein ABZW30_39095 [Kitasatospora sp. NPDC004669]|uniref:hypothetical protein n=1 Tax=Kitasatospora sp. NPDC004669 TaxID=3154555 RepID=UPI00339F42EA
MRPISPSLPSARRLFAAAAVAAALALGGAPAALAEPGDNGDITRSPMHSPTHSPKHSPSHSPRHSPSASPTRHEPHGGVGTGGGGTSGANAAEVIGGVALVAGAGGLTVRAMRRRPGRNAES